MDLRDWLLLSAILVALFGGRIWKFVDARRKRSVVRQVLTQLLENLKHDLLVIRDERNKSSEDQPSAKGLIEFSQTSQAEVSHYFDLFKDLVVPNLEELHLPKQSKVIELFDHYRKNIEAINRKRTLTLGTVNELIRRVDEAVGELSAR